MNTSYFGNIRNISNPVSISRATPKWFTGNRLLMLAPPWHLVKDIQDGKITEAEYTESYKEEVLARLDPARVYAIISNEFGTDATLMCYEKPGDFCHRHLVAEWFRDKLGIFVGELVVMPKLKK